MQRSHRTVDPIPAADTSGNSRHRPRQRDFFPARLLLVVMLVAAGGYTSSAAWANPDEPPPVVSDASELNQPAGNERLRLPEPTSKAGSSLKAISELTTDISLPPLGPGVRTGLEQPPSSAEQYFAQQQLSLRDLQATSSWGSPPGRTPNLDFCYRPLYFEQVNLERYGYSLRWFQPAASVAHFFGSIPLVPLKFRSQPPFICADHPHIALPGYPAPFELQRPRCPSVAGCRNRP